MFDIDSIYFIGNVSMFDIDSITGDIKVKSPMDRDSPDMRQTGGVYVLHVKVRLT